MEEKLFNLFEECKSELKNIGIDVYDEKKYGKIDIRLSKRKAKRYGCCRQENPDIKTLYRKNRKIYYKKFNMHHIEISKWVMDLNDDIIKNTIMHELIHCMPECNNHGKVFKQYEKYINERLGYSISTLGNKKQDYENSNLVYDENEERERDKYKVICESCNYTFFRKRMMKSFTRKYRCGKCGGKFKIYEIFLDKD